MPGFSRQNAKARQWNCLFSQLLRCGLSFTVALGLVLGDLQLHAFAAPQAITPTDSARLKALVLTAAQRNAARDFRGAEQAFTAMLQIVPNQVELYFARASTRLLQENSIGAIEDYSQAIKLAPTNPLAFYDRAITRLRNNELPLAIEDLNQTVVLATKSKNTQLLHSAQGVLNQILASQVSSSTREPNRLVTLGLGLGFPEANGPLRISGWQSQEARSSLLRTGDALLALNDQEIHAPNDINLFLSKHQAGDRIDVHIRRSNQNLSFPLILSDAPYHLPKISAAIPAIAKKLTPIAPVKWPTDDLARSAWLDAPVPLAAGTTLPVMLAITQRTDVPQKQQLPISGTVLFDVLDSNGVPLVPAGTTIKGQIEAAEPFGHRLVIESLGGTPLSARSEILPIREQLEGYSDGSVKLYRISSLYPSQVVGVTLQNPVSIPLPKANSVPNFPLDEPAVMAASPPQALNLYNQGVQAAIAGRVSTATNFWRASMLAAPTIQTRTALGWAYTQLGRSSLTLNNNTQAIAYLERSAFLRPQDADTLALLACAYAHRMTSALSNLTELAYFRHAAEQYGLNLKEFIGINGILYAEETPAPSQGDYLDRVVGAQGVIRLTRLPVRVYLRAAPSAELEAAVWAGAKRWEEASDGTIRFERVDNPLEADISVVFSKQTGVKEAGVASMETLGRLMPSVNVNLNLDQMLHIRLVDQSHFLETVATHEFGHALGLWGHSNNAEDIMFPEMSATDRPSAQDVRTLRKLYALPADISPP
ncbi:MAG: matrixin family metalloprotease [Anaerolineae bacterium]|nr:matrixin family metalloprotease [Gloeobacterales cyanobacterium ES-bin-313]